MAAKLAERPVFFDSPEAFREWLARHHTTAPELWVGYHKKATGRPSLTWSQSVDEALCFGWIDGLRRSLNADAYAIRFTKRRSGSTWSAVNVRKAKALVAEGRMRAAGLAAWKAMKPEKTGTYSFEQREAATLTRAEVAAFRRRRAAWEFFQTYPPGRRRTVTWWVVSAKRPETRRRRLETLIEASAAGRRLGEMRRRDQ